MPQLDTSTFTSQLFWLIVCFFSMLFIMSHFIVPRIADILEQRQHKIDGYLNKAHNIRLEAEDSLKKYQEALANATAKANESLAATQNELNSYMQKKQDELAAKLQKKIAAGEAEIAKSKEEALAKVKEMSEELAQAVVNKIGLTTISAKDIKDAVKTVEAKQK